ncbi:MAG TPA: hypothetical protein VLG49_03245 [Rhabdochlamydiaceae bacterium]|nr:hypothetical protein [Rhabdochlamydiaceae bacterium]HSX13124.1 hypothetical protein [Chlamydiales bacterium]
MKKYLKNTLFAAVLSTNLSLFADVPQPYASVNNLPQMPYYVLDGWVFFNLINTFNAGVIVDVDSQDGSVARYIAQQMPNLPSVKEIFSVSLWQSQDPSQKHLFQRFLSNIKQEGTAESITPIRMSSLEGASSLNIVADFVSVVGKNDENAIFNDIMAWYPHLSLTGVICGNNWHENSVQRGVARAASMLGLNLQISGNVWYFQKGSP